jgi:hypothetical protein
VIRHSGITSDILIEEHSLRGLTVHVEKVRPWPIWGCHVIKKIVLTNVDCSIQCESKGFSLRVYTAV